MHALQQQLRRGPPRNAGRSRIDARVHCAVLKKRTAPAPPPGKHRETRKPARTRKPAAQQGAGSLRTQQRAHPAPAPPPPFRAPRQGRENAY